VYLLGLLFCLFDIEHEITPFIDILKQLLTNHAFIILQQLSTVLAVGEGSKKHGFQVVDAVEICEQEKLAVAT
jgi:hypothetical protein